LSTSKAPLPPSAYDPEAGNTLYTHEAVHTIYFGDNLDILRRHVRNGAVNLIYVDPPFNTGKSQSHTRIKTVRSISGDRVGFQGQRYEPVKMGSRAFPDAFDDYPSFLEPRLREAHRVLAADGTLYVHLDYCEVHYCNLLHLRTFRTRRSPI